MRYVILRDDDTNALTPVECLERLYRPFLERRLPVNLAVIPDVALDARTPEGKREGFLPAQSERLELERVTAGRAAGGLGGRENIQHPTSNIQHRTNVPIGVNQELVRYLTENTGYQIVQHGCHHDCFEFERESVAEISERLERGLHLLNEAGFPRPVTFVAPHDKFSRASYREVAKRFRVISSGWFEWGRLPVSWRARYLGKKMNRAAHWTVGRTILLSHPGCLLSVNRDFNSMFDEVRQCIERERLTVLVTHWWEYFRDGEAREEFIGVLHRVAEYLASRDDIKVISFAELAQGRMPLN